MNDKSIHDEHPGLSDVRITIIYDNKRMLENTKESWGFSCLIEGAQHTILFDTGGEGDILLANMAALGIDPESIDVVVISHAHGDHAGGLEAFLDAASSPDVYMLQSFPDKLKNIATENKAAVIEVISDHEICPDCFTTGEMDSQLKFKEQSLVLQTAKGAIVITGCAHPGIVSIAKKAAEIVDGDLLFVMGGFHLLETPEEEIEDIISRFHEMKIPYSGACHCTGDKAIEMFSRAYSDKFIEIGTGKVINLSDLK